MRSARFSFMPLRSLLYAAIGFAGVLLLIFFGLHPLQATIRQMDEETATLKARLAQQKELAPLYRDFAARFVTDVSDRLPAPEKSGLSIDQVIGISVQLHKLAEECGLDTISAAPEVKAFTRDRKFMPVNLILKGNFLKLRKFLFDLHSLPCLAHIEGLHIQETGGAQEFRLKVWIAVNPQKSS